MAQQLADDSGQYVFVDDNGVTLFLDDDGNYLGVLPSTGGIHAVKNHGHMVTRKR